MTDEERGRCLTGDPVEDTRRLNEALRERAEWKAKAEIMQGRAERAERALVELDGGEGE
jgi:hypothetical protein